MSALTPRQQYLNDVAAEKGEPAPFPTATETPIEVAARLIATAEAHLDASEQSRFSHANGVELLDALRALHDSAAKIKGAISVLLQVHCRHHQWDDPKEMLNVHVGAAPEFTGPPPEIYSGAWQELGRFSGAVQP